jgi:hypothetical protein
VEDILSAAEKPTATPPPSDKALDAAIPTVTERDGEA